MSGPLLDRFDLRVHVNRPDPSELVGEGASSEEPSAVVAARVAAARQVAVERGARANAEIAGPDLDRLAPLAGGARSLLETRLRQGLLSARGVHRVRRVARTLADLGGRPGPVCEDDVLAALALRAAVFETDRTAGEVGLVAL